MRVIFSTTALALLLASGTSSNSEAEENFPTQQQSYYKAPGHDKYHLFYKEVQKQLGISGCCDDLNNDCGPAPYRLLNSGGVEFLLEDGKWYLFPSKPYFIITPDKKGHVCRKPYLDKENVKKYYFYCAFLPYNGI